jgi:hypothetical protein
VPTTSHPPKPSSASSSGSGSNRNGSTSRGGPLKSIRLKVTFVGAGGKELARLAAGKGLAVEHEGGKESLVISAATPEDALSQLKLLTGILASRT